MKTFRFISLVVITIMTIVFTVLGNIYFHPHDIAVLKWVWLWCLVVEFFLLREAIFPYGLYLIAGGSNKKIRIL